jgi:hypothetical protein
MDDELKSALVAMQGSLAAMDGRLGAMEDRLIARIEKTETGLEERLLARIEKAEAGLEERLLARIEETETKLLSAFHGWARPMEIRQRSTTSIVTGFDERLSLVEERVSQIERRKN